MWLAYPHARRETFLELSFLGIPALLGLIGWVMVPRFAGPWQTDPTTFQQIPATRVPTAAKAIAHRANVLMFRFICYASMHIEQWLGSADPAVM